MKAIGKNIYYASILLCLISLCYSCSSSSEQKVSKKKMSSSLTTRNLAKTVVAKEFYYQSLATLRKGDLLNSLELDDLLLEAEWSNLLIVYDNEAPWANLLLDGDYSLTGDDKLNNLIEGYDLAITKQFEIDEENNGLILRPQGPISDVVEVARSLSLIDHVIMVHLKEIPEEDLK